MKARATAGGVAVGAIFLFGCASIVGIGDLNPPDGGSSGGRPGSSSGGSSSGSGMGTCNPPSPATCQIDPQCGCVAGDKCDFSASTIPACIAAGTGTSGELCNSATSCAAGFTCIVGVCHPFCNVPGNACQAAASGPPVSVCIQVTDNNVAIPQAEYCLFDCTPVPNNCPAGQACVVAQLTLASGTVNATNCEVPGTGAAGASCATDGNADCQAGYECYNSVCTQFCRSASDCAGGVACNTTVGLAFDGVTYGFCE